MRHSLIINTACGDAMTAGKRNPYRQARYGERAEMLRQTLQDDYGFNEVIVSGVFPRALVEEFPDILWIETPPQRRNRWDGLLQREMGARFATGDTLTFCHDDHAPGLGYAHNIEHLSHDDWDILVPQRFHAENGEELNNGSPKFENPPYMGGHCYTMKRWIWAGLPLTSAPDEWWDIYLTPRWVRLGAKIIYSEVLSHYDLEASAEER